MKKSLWQKFVSIFYHKYPPGSRIPVRMARVHFDWNNLYTWYALWPLHYVFIFAWKVNSAWNKYRGSDSWIDGQIESGIARQREIKRTANARFYKEHNFVRTQKEVILARARRNESTEGGKATDDKDI